MSRLRSRAVCLVFAASLAAPVGASSGTEIGVVSGRVLNAAQGIGAARVWAYQLVDQTLHRTVTADSGEFLFDALPAGLYKVIAFKSGFAPAMLLLTRATIGSRQYLELELAAPDAEGEVTSSDFWSVRGQLPGDVLRDIETIEVSRRTLEPQAAADSLRGLLTVLGAESGLAEIGEKSTGQVSGGEVGVRGRLGPLDLDLSGDYRQVAAEGGNWAGFSMPSAQAASVSLRLGGPGDSQVRLHSLSNRMTARRGDDVVPVDLEHHQLSWSQAYSPASSSAFFAQYTDESGLYARARNDPATIPVASRTWRVEGYYTHTLSDRSRLQAGMRLRQQLGDLAGGSAFGAPVFDQRTLELFGLGGWRVQPGVLVEYGLYSTLHDGSVSLVPRGGLVLQLGELWQAAMVGSHRVALDGEAMRPYGFLPAEFEAQRSCDQAELACYLLSVSRGHEGHDRVSLRASHREFDQTVRMYFGRDFFDHLESVFLVPGDRLPEVQLDVEQRLAPRVLTRISSSVGVGGGGVYYAANRHPYENEVRYLVTSVDTQFQRSATGVYVAFQRLEQELTPLVGRNNPQRRAAGQIELERLELGLTQKLNVLFDLAADWAVRLNMELSRGITPFRLDLPDSELRKSVSTGVAVSF